MEKKKHFLGSDKYYMEETAYIMYQIKQQNIRPTDGLKGLLECSYDIQNSLPTNAIKHFEYLIEILCRIKDSAPYAFKGATANPSQMKHIASIVIERAVHSNQDDDCIFTILEVLANSVYSLTDSSIKIKWDLDNLEKSSLGDNFTTSIIGKALDGMINLGLTAIFEGANVVKNATKRLNSKFSDDEQNQIAQEIKNNYKTKDQIISYLQFYNKCIGFLDDGGQKNMVDAKTIDMIFVQGGTFMMGNNQITLNSFSIGKYLITQSQWQAVMGGGHPAIFGGEITSGDHPKVNVAWDSAYLGDNVQQFLKELNKQTGKKYRLPTSAEWEYVARGGEKSRNYKYSGSNNIDDVAWYNANSNRKTQPVGTKLPNELGVYDMSGNVYEWCQDKEGSKRVSRGGSWSSGVEHCCVTDRSGSAVGDRMYTSRGFRVVLS